MIDIEMQEMSPAFFEAWQAAGQHLDRQLQGDHRSWLRSHPNPPFLEHLSFRIGNQLFFVRVEDEDRHVPGPGSVRGLLMVARGCGGHACLLPMRKVGAGGWSPAHPGWGLLDAATGQPLHPVERVSDERIEMTAWELQDFAVQVVRTQLQKEGFKLMSWQSNPDVDPAIWFVGASGGPEWVVVRAARYPANSAARPDNWQAIAASCARQSRIGHFASVAFASTAQPFQQAGEAAVPLWRGHGTHVNYAGLA